MICEVVLTTCETGEFKELLISQKVLEIELNRFHFWRLCFFEVFAADIRFLDQEFPFSNSAKTHYYHGGI